MLDAARAIVQFAQDKSEDDFLKTRSLRDAVHWNFCVVGEALSQALARDETMAQQITDCHKIIELRNQLIHGYGVINHHITWNVVQDKYPC